MPDDEIQFPRSDESKSREEEKNQPEYLGDKVDEAVARMEEEGEPLSDRAQRLVDEGKAELRAILEEDDDE